MDNRKINIPSQAGKLLGFLSAYNKEFDALEMIEELYMEKHQSEGRYKAGLWLWKQVLLSIPKYISLILSRSLAMFKNYLKIAIRNLKKSTAYSVLNIIGLSVGMACFVLIALYVKFELSFDNYHENGDNIYRVAQHLREGNAQEGNYLLAQTRMPLAPILKVRFPEVIQSIRLFDAFYVHLKIGDKDFFEDKLFFADQDVFKVFTYTFIQGDPETALRDPYSIVLTERTAEKYFGSTDVIGRTIIYNDKYNYKVTGIIANIPDNSHFIVDMLLSYRSVEYDQNSGKIDLNGWHGPVGYTYIVLEEQTDIDDFSTKILDLQKEVNPYAVEDGHNRLFLQPLTKIHLYSKLHSEISSNGDITTIVIFSIIAVLILLIACINYMNLSTARSTTRAREVGLRKVFGARRRHLANQFLGESVLIILTALVIAVFLVNLTLTSYNNFVGINLRFDIINDYQIILILLFTAVFVGLTAGSYPALYISSFKPVTVLRNILNKGTKGRDLRDYLVIGQFAISIILIICTIIVREQLSYINNTDLGYDKDNVIVIKILD
ncbi:MAG: FtsX-like permease family protein, partial [bacterium]|nr:FtsX-like permease family protein [bacterium]